MRHVLLLVLLLAVAGIAYQLLAPAEVNGDGIGYLWRVDGVGLSPGHLAYLPLIRKVAGLTQHRVLIDLVGPLRLLSIGCALLTLAFLFDAGRRVHGPGPALFATALLAASFGFARSAMQVEVYAVSTLMAVALLWALVRYAECAGVGWAVLAGVFCGAGVHFHLTLLLLGPPMAVLLIRWGPQRGRLRNASLAVGVAAAVVLVPLLVVLRKAGITDLGAAAAWLTSADHGIPYPRPLLGPVIAIWGVVRSLLFVPYLYESSLPVVVALTVSGGAAWLLLLVLCRRGRPGQRLDGTFVLVWCVPLALFAAFFFPSDTERWIFVLPAVFLWLAPAAGRLAYAVVAILVLANATGFLPAALDREPADRAALVDRFATARDLVVSPGHGWEEMVGLTSRIPPATFPLIYHAGAREDLDTAVRDIHERIRRTLAAGGRVFVARLRDSPDPRGFKELEWFGMTRDDFADLFAAYETVPTDVPELWELRDR